MHVIEAIAVLSGLLAREAAKLRDAVERSKPKISQFPSSAQFGGSYLQVERRGLKSKIPLVDNSTLGKRSGRFI